MSKFSAEILQAAEKAHYDFQLGMFFTERVNRRNYTLLFNKYIADPYWNYATQIMVPRNRITGFLEDVEGYYKQRSRSPSCYVTPWTRPKNLGLLLGSRYRLAYKEAWMFYDREEQKIPLPPNVAVEEIGSLEEFHVFLDVFDRSYDEASPYGKLEPGYVRSLRESWGKKKARYFLALYDDHPAGVGTLHCDGRFAELNGLGVLPEYRGKGIGAVLSNVRVVEAKRLGAETSFLQTEAGSALEPWHKKRGFRTRFVAFGYVKKD